MGKKLIVANWKMHFTTGQASLFLHKLEQLIEPSAKVEVVLCPSALSLQPLSLQINHRQFRLGAQNCFYEDEGAFTGEISATMLRGLAHYVIVGHSERRYILGEHDKDVRKKVKAVLRNGLQPIICVGETAQERKDGETADAIHAQMSAGLAEVSAEDIDQIVIAYEPVWAVGTGNFAKPSDVTEAITLVRKQVAAHFGDEVSQKVRVLYGGSVDAENASAYLNLPEVDGLLVGGASLNASVFSKIVSSANSSTSQGK